MTNEETIYLQNTSTTRNLFIDRIAVSPDTTSIWRIKFVTGTASGGSVLTPTNLNKTSSNDAETNVRGDGAVTGLTDDGDIIAFRVTGGTTRTIDARGEIILGQNDAIAVECETNSAVDITIEFHLE